MKVWVMVKRVSLNDAAAEDTVASIEHRRLPWAQCSLRLTEDNAKRAI
jgi:hypothetical protein